MVKNKNALPAAGSEQLELRVQMLEQTLAYCDEAIWIKDLDAVVMFWNHGATELYGFPSSEAIGHSVRELHAADLSEEEYATLLAQLQSGRTNTAIVERRKQNGQHVKVRVQKSPLFDASGTLIGEAAVARDITEVHRIEEALSLVKMTLKDKQEANVILKQEISSRKKSESMLRDLNQKLNGTVERLGLIQRDNDILSCMAELMQTCADEQEAFAVLCDAVKGMFDGVSGRFSIYRESRDYLKTVMSWGGDSVRQEMLQPQECWALRLGRIHVASDSHSMRCEHMKGSSHCYVCVPVNGQGQFLGLMQLDLDATTLDQKRLQALAGRIGPGLANLKLRESLRSLALRDALTGLYNRRYLDDALQRMLAHTKRSLKPCSVIMIDIDHFKQFNDTFGHDAGDYVLGSVGKCIISHVRLTDMACRYGGEELVILLPETGLVDAKQRAEEIRVLIGKLSNSRNGQTLPALTASFGVAEAPTHGDSGIDLLKAADRALYRAKGKGRDRVCGADEVI